METDLFDFAYIPDWYGQLEELEGMVLPEPWQFKRPSVETKNQDTPLEMGLVPVLNIDVWEHAYYLGYQNRRGDYFESWWRLVDWPQLSEAYEKLLQNRPQCAK